MYSTLQCVGQPPHSRVSAGMGWRDADDRNCNSGGMPVLPEILLSVDSGVQEFHSQ